MKTDIYAYSTVKGYLHIKNNSKNQDAYVLKKYSFGTVMVVSDGHGSHINSHIGSRAVCKAVLKAVNIWNEKSCTEIKLIIPLIHSLWNVEIYPYLKNECGATCLFVIIMNNGKIYAGQLGDGDIHLFIDEKHVIHNEKEDDFSNVTSGMSSIKSFSEWKISEYDAFDKSFYIVMMTDGVSETLIPERKIEFLKLIHEKIIECNSLYKRNNLIFHMLKKWNKVSSGDDRTMLYYKKD